MRPIGFLLGILFLATAAAAQLGETIEVRVANVDVVVTDRAGKPVHGLTKDDFELLENGKPQPITNFYELRDPAAAATPGQVTGAELPAATAPPADLQRRRVVIFVDQESIAPNRRVPAFESLDKALSKVLRPNDEAMVVAFHSNRRVVANLTSDVAAIRKALQEVATASNTTTNRTGARDRVIANANDLMNFARENPRMMTMRQAYQQAYATATSYADELHNTQRRLVGSIQQTVGALAGLDGKKVMIFVGGDLQARPGVDVFDAVDNTFRTTGVSVVGSAQSGEASKRSLQADFEKLGRDANTNGVTLYMIDAGPNRGMTTRSAAENVRIEGNEALDTFADIETLMSMNAIAALTGGRALVGSINYDLAIDNLTRDLGSYYSLGYKPAGDGERRIAVRVKKPGLVARSRRTFTLESSDEQMNDRVAANAFHTLAGNDMPVTVQVGKPEPDGDVFRIPLTIKFPGDITAIPDGTGQLASEFAVYVRTASVDGNISPVVKDQRNFKYPQAHQKAVQAQQVTYTMGLRVRAGEQIVSVAVVDKLSGKTGYGRMKFTAP